MNVSYNPTRVCGRCKCCSPTLDIRPSDQLLCDDCWLGTLQQEGVLVDYLCNIDFEDGTNDLRDTEILKPAEGKADSNKVTIDTEIVGGSCSMKSLNMDHNDEDSQNKIEDYVSGTTLGRDTFTSDAFSETSEHEPAQIYQSRSGCCHGLVPEDSTNKPVNSNSDSVIRHIVFVTKSGKQRCKFKGNVSELHDIVKFDLKINGSWSHARDPNHCIFRSNCKQITINFWQSTQSFTVCGKKEKEIKKKLKTLASSYEKSLMRNDTTS